MPGIQVGIVVNLQVAYFNKNLFYSLFAKPEKKDKKDFYSVKHFEQKLCTSEWRLHNQICGCKGVPKQPGLDLKSYQEDWDSKNSIVLLKLPNAAEAASFVENLKVCFGFRKTFYYFNG